MMYVDGWIYLLLEWLLMLYVVFKDGLVVVGELKIVLDCKMIDYVFVINIYGEEQLRAVCKVVKVIEEVDMVVLGLGSFFISILFNLVIIEIGEVIK